MLCAQQGQKRGRNWIGVRGYCVERKETINANSWQGQNEARGCMY